VREPSFAASLLAVFSNLGHGICERDFWIESDQPAPAEREWLNPNFED